MSSEALAMIYMLVIIFGAMFGWGISNGLVNWLFGQNADHTGDHQEAFDPTDTKFVEKYAKPVITFDEFLKMYAMFPENWGFDECGPLYRLEVKTSGGNADKAKKRSKSLAAFRWNASEKEYGRSDIRWMRVGFSKEDWRRYESWFLTETKRIEAEEKRKKIVKKEKEMEQIQSKVVTSWIEDIEQYRKKTAAETSAMKRKNEKEKADAIERATIRDQVLGSSNF